MKSVTTSVLAGIGLNLLLYIAAIVIGLLIFFKGRAHVRRKYGKK